MKTFIAYSVMDFKVGDKYSHSAHGIGEVISVEPHSFMCSKLTCKVVQELTGEKISYQEFIKNLRDKNN